MSIYYTIEPTKGLTQFSENGSGEEEPEALLEKC